MSTNEYVPPPKPKRNLTTKKQAAESGNQQLRKAREHAAKLKAKLTRLQNKIDAVETVKSALNDQPAGLITSDQLEAVSPTVQQHLEQEDKIIFRPTDKQIEFLAADEREVFYGGARGGGKSYAMLVDPLRFCDRPTARALIIRRTMPELRDMIHKSQMLYSKAYPGAKWREQDKEWRFPSGARIEFGYCENIQDVLRYQGQSYSWIGVDELPQFPTAEILNFLRSSLRPTEPGIPIYLRATGNPGNVGSRWVKEEFINPAPANTTFYIDVEFNHPTKGLIKEKISRRYIPASVYDNPYLTMDNSYLAMLASLPPVQRKQFLEGNWDVFEGAAFSEFDRSVHVVTPFEIPNNWPRFRAADWGYAAPACCLWFAVSPDQQLIVYRELYVTKKTADQFADLVLYAENSERVNYGVLDASTWAQRGDNGPSIAESMIRKGCRWRQSDRSPRSRYAGKLEVHRRLAIDPVSQKPRLVVFNTCVNLIRTLSDLPTDKDDPEDVDTKAEDHAYDALRYGCMSRPLFVLNKVDPLARPAFRPSDSTFGY
jgi:hypothetical protein